MRHLPRSADDAIDVVIDVTDGPSEPGSTTRTVADASNGAHLTPGHDRFDHRTGTAVAVLLVGLASPAAVTALWWSAAGWG